MPVIGSTGSSNNKSPLGKTEQALSLLDKSVGMEAIFVDESGRTLVSRDYLEMVAEEFSRATENQSFFNKFLNLDTKLDKSLREYKADVKALLSEATELFQAQQSAMAPDQTANEVQPQAPTEASQGPIV